MYAKVEIPTNNSPLHRTGIKRPHAAAILRRQAGLMKSKTKNTTSGMRNSARRHAISSNHRPMRQSTLEPALDTRQRLLSTARRLFYTEGPRAVGIDRVLAESGVAKMSLYRHFGSKDALIVACLNAHERDYWQLWDSHVDAENASPAQQIRNAILFIARRTADPTYRGCIFLNTAQTFPDESHPARQKSIDHKQQLASRLLKHAKAAAAADPKALARQLMLLINGAQATAGMLGKETQYAIVDATNFLLLSHGVKD
jgi:AcrR family transcriptional regulator